MVNLSVTMLTENKVALNAVNLNLDRKHKQTNNK